MMRVLFRIAGVNVIRCEDAVRVDMCDNVLMFYNCAGVRFYSYTANDSGTALMLIKRITADGYLDFVH